MYALKNKNRVGVVPFYVFIISLKGGKSQRFRFAFSLELQNMEQVLKREKSPRFTRKTGRFLAF